MVKAVSRFEVWLVALDPVRGSEMRKTRPCLVVSPDEMNGWLRTIIVAPMTTVGRAWPSRVPVVFEGRSGEIALDQVRTVDKERLTKRLGSVPDETQRAVSDTLVEMFTL
jgi:mRNA interferase MazF